MERLYSYDPGARMRPIIGKLLHHSTNSLTSVPLGVSEWDRPPVAWRWNLPPESPAAAEPPRLSIEPDVNIDKHHQLITHTHTLSLRYIGHFPGGPGLAGTRTSPFWILPELRMTEMVVTTEAVRRAKLQIVTINKPSLTNTQVFFFDLADCVQYISMSTNNIHNHCSNWSILMTDFMLCYVLDASILCTFHLVLLNGASELHLVANYKRRWWL